MVTNFELVREFHDRFERPIPARPLLPDRATAGLRLSLILEEARELNDALAQYDMVGIADALCDLLYVTYGAGLDFGINLDACFAEVHRSNMTKLGADGRPIVRKDGKILKGPAYDPPHLERILEA